MSTYQSFPLPDSLVSDPDFADALQAEVMKQAVMDVPSRCDALYLFQRYNASSEDARDAIDSTLVWLAGYTLETLAARAVAKPGQDFEDVKAEWRAGQRKRH